MRAVALPPIEIRTITNRRASIRITRILQRKKEASTHPDSFALNKSLLFPPSQKSAELLPDKYTWVHQPENETPTRRNSVTHSQVNSTRARVWITTALRRISLRRLRKLIKITK